VNSPSLTISDVAALLGLSTRTVSTLMRTGKLAHYKIGSHVRFTQEDVDNYIASCRVDGKHQKKREPMRLRYLKEA
jgi:excisionase family DNA binding protein